MTRFARAKGSKAFNERAPEDGTPWEIMKEQLLQSKKENEDSNKRQEAEKQRIENYQNFLKEQKIQKRKATWCDFPETDYNRDKNEPLKKKQKKNDIQNPSHDANDVDNDTSAKNGKKERKRQKKIDQTKLILDTKTKSNEFITEENTNNMSTLSSKKGKQKKPKECKQQINNNQQSDVKIKQNDLQKANNAHKNKKVKKLVDGKPLRRKEVNDKSFQLIINGKDVDLVRFDGFPIMKKDAERLQELKNTMIKKGIPKGEVQRTMKLERRRAEKALARLKRDVCYNCRKGGHNLSDCPDLKSRIPGVDAADGVCFKCGSTEHKQFECKVQKNGDFKFATCFICKEPGHIARQCPDNPKGLYPNGGCCKLCGDVTHLRKDCPTAQDKKEESSIKLQTLDGDNNIEGIGHLNTTTNSEISKKPKKIKF